MLKVALVIPRLSDGGAQVQVSRLFNELSERGGIEVHLVLWGPGVHDNLVDPQRGNIHTLDIRRGTDLRGVTRLRRLLRKLDVDIAMSWLSIADVHAGIATLGRKPAWILAERDSAYPERPLYIVRRWLSRRARAIVANSEAGVRLWAEHGYDGPLFQVDNILAPVETQHRANGSVGHLRILSVGRLEPQKAPGRVLDALSALFADRPDIRATFVGDGALRRGLEAQALAAGMEQKVEFVGFQADVPRWLERADVFVTLSRHEGLPNALLEAVQRGVPVVASDIPEHVSVLGEGYPYLISDDCSAAEAACVLMRACDEGLPLGAYAHAAARIRGMSPGGVADRYLGIFRDVIGE